MASPKKANRPQVNTQRPITARNAKRLAKKNKDVIHGRHSEQVDREAEEEKDSRDSASLRV